MLKRIPGWITGAAIFALCLLVIYGSGCKEGNNSTPLSMTLSGFGPSSDVQEAYTGSFSLTGYVKNDNVPVPNLNIELLVGDLVVTAPVLTTGEGQFFFNGLAPALYTLRVGHDSATFTEMLYPVYIDTAGVQSPSNISIPIELKNPTVILASGTIEATVVNASSNNGVALATVSLSLYSGGVWVDQNVKTLTTGSGYFSFAGVSPGLYNLSITKTGYVSMEYPVNIQSDGTMIPSKPSIPMTMASVDQTITGNLSGFAKDVSGSVLPEITITAKDSKTNLAVAGSPQKTTTEGKFTFYSLPVGEYSITASGIGYATVTRTSYIRSDGTADPTATQLVLSRVEAVSGVLLGLVKLENGTALPEISINIKDIRTNLPVEGSPRKTTTEGKYIFENIPPGDYEVSASGAGYSTATRTCYIRSDGTADPATTDIVLTRITAINGNIFGYAKLDITGAVLPEISVTAKDAVTNVAVEGSPRKTTSEGKYTFYNLPPGEYSVSASGAGYTTVTRTCYIKSDGTADPVSTDLLLSRTMESSMIEAYVVDASNNSAVILATVSLSLYSGGNWVDQNKKTLTNGSGYFSFSGINPGTYLLSITKAGYVAKDFPVTINSDGTKDPAMPKIPLTSIAQAITGIISGVVKLDVTGAVLPEISVSIKDSSNQHVVGSPLKTTPEGKFSFYDLLPGAYTVNASGTGYTEVTRTCYIRSNGAADPTSTNISLSRSPVNGTISGYVRDTAGVALPEMSVNLKDSTGAIVGTPLKTTSEGKYAFTGLPEDSYTINASGTGYTSVTRTAYIKSDGTADPITTNITLSRVPSVTGTIIGYILASNSAVLPEIDVSLQDSGGNPVGSAIKTTAEGKFLFENLAPDTYTIIVPGSVDGVPTYDPVIRTCYIRINGVSDPTQTTILLQEL